MSTRAVILTGWSGCAVEALVSRAGPAQRLQELLSWLFSQSRPSHPCPVFLFSYLREERWVQREPRTDHRGRRQGRGSRRGGPGAPWDVPAPATGLPEPRRRPGLGGHTALSAPGAGRTSCLGEGRLGAMATPATGSPPGPVTWPRQGDLPRLTEMLLDSVQDVHAVLAVHHVHGQAPLAKAAGAPDPVQVGLVVRVPILVHGEVKVDDDRHLFHIDTCVREELDGSEDGDRNRRRPVRPTLTKLRRKAGSATGQLWCWDTDRWQNPEGEDGTVPVLAKFRHQSRSLCWIRGSGEAADAALGPQEQAPSLATSQGSRLLWTFSSTEGAPQAGPQNSISLKPSQPPTQEDLSAAPSLAGQDPVSAYRGHTRWW